MVICRKLSFLLVISPQNHPFLTFLSESWVSFFHQVWLSVFHLFYKFKFFLAFLMKKFFFLWVSKYIIVSMESKSLQFYCPLALRDDLIIKKEITFIGLRSTRRLVPVAFLSCPWSSYPFVESLTTTSVGSSNGSHHSMPPLHIDRG